MGAGRGRLVTGMHCDWFHVFDFVGPAAMVGSQELPVPRRCWSIWGLVVSLGNNSGLWQNNLVPTVTASFDVLEAGDMVEGCSIWVSVRLGSNRCRLGCFLICRLLLRRLRFLLPCLRVRSCEEFLWLAAFLRSVAATSVQRSSLGVVSFV